MKTVVTKAFGHPPETVIEDRPKPEPRAGHSLVRMRSATINQLSNFIRTEGIGGTKAPLVLGNEGAGSIEHSDRFAPGTRVGIYGGNRLGIVEDGLFQQWVLVEDRRLFALPETLDWDQGATLSVNYLTAYRALTKAVRTRPGQIVLVAGATGSVGQALVQVAQALDAHPVAVVSSADKARRAREAGMPAVIDLSAEADLAAKVRDLTGGKGADLAFDPVGGPLLNRLLASLASRGTLVSLGFTGGRHPAFDAYEIIAKEKAIIGYALHAEADEEVAIALEELVKLAAGGALKPVIDSVVELEEVEKGYARLTSRDAVGSIVLRL